MTLAAGKSISSFMSVPPCTGLCYLQRQPFVENESIPQYSWNLEKELAIMAILRHRFSVQIPQHCWNLGRRGRHASAPCLSGRCHLRVRRRPSHESKRRRPLQCTAPSSSQEQVGFLNKSLHSFRKSGNFMAASKWRTGPQTTGSQRRMPEVVGSLGWLPTPQERSVRPSSTRLTGYTHSSLHHSTPQSTLSKLLPSARRRAPSLLSSLHLPRCERCKRARRLPRG